MDGAERKTVRDFGWLLLELSELRARLAAAPDMAVSVSASRGQGTPAQQITATTKQLRDNLKSISFLLAERMAKDDIWEIARDPFPDKQDQRTIALARVMVDEMNKIMTTSAEGTPPN